MGQAQNETRAQLTEARAPSDAREPFTGPSAVQLSSGAQKSRWHHHPDNVHEMWGTDMTQAFTRTDGWVSVFGAVDHFSAACMGVHGAKPGTRFEALEPVRQGVRENLSAFAEGVALGITMRHDCGSQYVSGDFQDELKFLGFKPSPAFVRSPECNGCIERFFRTLKENLLWVREFEDIEDLNQALQEFKERYNREWLIVRHNCKTPNQVIEQDLTSLAEAA